jgi:hypothetical protein
MLCVPHELVQTVNHMKVEVLKVKKHNNTLVENHFNSPTLATFQLTTDYKS